MFAVKDRESALIMVPANYPDDCVQDLFEIPQIDVSMLMPCYPGRFCRLGGVRVCAEASPARHSGHKHIDLLFRVSSPTQFLAAASRLRSIRLRPEAYRRRILAGPYPIEIFQEEQIYQIFSPARRKKHISGQGRYICAPAPKTAVQCRPRR